MEESQEEAPWAGRCGTILLVTVSSSSYSRAAHRDQQDRVCLRMNKSYTCRHVLGAGLG